MPQSLTVKPRIQAITSRAAQQNECKGFHGFNRCNRFNGFFEFIKC